MLLFRCATGEAWPEIMLDAKVRFTQKKFVYHPDGTFKLTSVASSRITLWRFMWYHSDVFRYMLKADFLIFFFNLTRRGFSAYEP